MREIKFRAWDEEIGRMVPWELLRDTKLFDDGFDNRDCILMQFTGLKDKNGKEIYEGDIVRILRDDKMAFVEWNDGAFELLTPVHVFYGHLWIHYPSNIEIIGNIYENPELLK